MSTAARVALPLAFVLATTSATAQPAAPPPADPVQTKVDQAMAYYEAADLARALEAFAAAYALEPRPDILFAMAGIHVERGDCARAIEAYRKFLESKPGPNSTQIATDAIARCQQILAASGQAAPAEPDARTPVAPEPARPRPLPPGPPPTTTTQRPWYTDALGDALVAGGAAALVTGSVLYLSARTDLAKADQGGPGGITLDERNDLVDSADTKERWAGITAGVGAAFVVGGVVRYLTGDRTETVTLAPAGGRGDGATLTARWRF